MSLELNPRATFYFKDGKNCDLSSVTHLSIGAHQDDLEFMSAYPIYQCKDVDNFSFLGVICTDGRSSSRSASFAHVSDEEMVQIRQEEQLKAAQKGAYFGVIQLNYQSSHLKKDKGHFDSLKNDLKKIIEACQAENVYTHNPFDKHVTHLSVCQAVIEVMKEQSQLPKEFLGAEVWRSLDWLPDSLKLRKNLKVSESELLNLMNIFQSQIAGAKNYSEAVIGRKKSNATFNESHDIDQVILQEVFVDLLPALRMNELEDFCHQILSSFQEEVFNKLRETKLWK